MSSVYWIEAIRETRRAFTMDKMETLKIGLCALAFVCVSTVSSVQLEETDLSCYTCSDTVITADEDSTRDEVADLYSPQDASCRNAMKEKMAVKKCYIRPNLGRVPKCYTKTTVMNGISPVSHKNYSFNMLERRCLWAYTSWDDKCHDFMPTAKPGELTGVSGKQCYCSSETCNNIPGLSPNNGQTTLSSRSISYFLGVVVAVYFRFLTVRRDT